MRLILLPLLFFTLQTFAWDEHTRVTQHALSGIVPGDRIVKYETLDTALAALQGTEFPTARNTSDLLRELKVNPNFEFARIFKEPKKSPYYLRDFLAGYSDEPDWQLETNLFNIYPELWNDDMKYVTGREGKSSQAFRHQFFPGKFLWSQPIGSYQIPMKPLGEAPERAQLYLRLSQRLLAAGHDYWGYRFLAWSLHYVQDLFQPFHSRQTPSKRLIVFQLKSPFINVPATTEVVAYHHLAYEKVIAREMRSKQTPLRKALNGSDTLLPPDANIAEWIKAEVVDFAGSHASNIAGKARKIFPPLPNYEAGISERFVNSAKYAEGMKGKEKQIEALVESTLPLYEKLGKVARGFYKLASEAEGSQHGHNRNELQSANR